MSTDALRSRLHEDLENQVQDATAVLQTARQLPLDELRYLQGMIAGYRTAQKLLEERHRNLYAIG